MRFNTYPHNFGILIPRDNGIIWTHQGGGMMCHQLDFEGVFVPMKSPWTSTDDEGIVHLDEERRLYDYSGDDERCTLSWDSYDEVHEKMLEEFSLEIEEVEFEEIPEGYPQHGTSHEWIRVNGVKKKDDGRPKLYNFELGDVKGEVVALFYQNVD